MAQFPIDRPWELVISGDAESSLNQHLFPGDGDEHGAVLLAGVHILPRRVRLLVREVIPAADGIDHVPGTRGYKMLTAQFIRPHLLRARDERLVYLSVHNHGGSDRVDFSRDDLASHERGYPALLDIVKGMPVGALVFARNAVAGDIWLPDGTRRPISRATITARRRKIIYPAPPVVRNETFKTLYDRQVRLFGESGQAILGEASVGIIGLGGMGSILAELLGRLGVGKFVLIDPERADVSNLPRLLGSKRSDALMSEDLTKGFGTIRKIVDRLFRRRKVDLARRNIRRANPRASVNVQYGSVVDQKQAAALLECDYIFLAADEMIARLVFNAIVHQYLIPGIQVGARVVTDPGTGDVIDVYAVSRPVTPDSGCLWCNSLIDRTKLQIEATSADQARQQNYGTDTPAPSVVSLNALAAAEAVNTFLFYITGLTEAKADRAYLRFRPLRRLLNFDEPCKDERCLECGHSLPGSRFAAGDEASLPTVAMH